MDFEWYALSSACHMLRYMSEMSFPIAGSHSDSVVVGGMFTCIAFLLPFTLAILLCYCIHKKVKAKEGVYNAAEGK